MEGRSGGGSLQSCLWMRDTPREASPRQALAQPHLDSFCKSIRLRQLAVEAPSLGGPQ